MKIKDYLIAVGTAAAAALAIALFIGLLALIGWPVVWVALVILVTSEQRGRRIWRAVA